MKSELEVFHGQPRLGHLVEEALGSWAFIYSPDFLADPLDATTSPRSSEPFYRMPIFGDSWHGKSVCHKDATSGYSGPSAETASVR
jgi:hypothetical protein